MNPIQILFKNTSWLTVSQILTNIFAFVWTILIARYLGVSDFGVIGFATSFMTIASIFMDIGLSPYATRDLSRDQSLTNKYLGNMIPLKIFLSLIILLVVTGILYLMNYPILVIDICIIFGLQFFIMGMVALVNGVFQAYEKMEYQSIGIVINSGGLLIFTIIAIHLDLGIVSIAVAYLLAAIANISYLIKSLKSKIISKIKIEFDLKFWIEISKKSYPFGLTSFFTSIYFLIDTVMLSMISGDYAVGIYSSAYKVIYVFTTIYGVYTMVVFPLMSKLYKNSKDLLKISYEKSVKYLLLFTVPLSIGISFYAKYIIVLLFGHQYEPSTIVLQILIWNLMFLFVNGASTVLLNSSNHEMSVTKINLIACVFNVLINIVLIYQLSYVGASISVVLTGLVIFISMAHLITKKIFVITKALFMDTVKILISSAIIAIVLYIGTYIIPLNIWIAAPLVIIIYAIAILALKTLDDGDKFIVKELLGKN
ncbi:MAG: flippase [Methanobrevibacter sp.]|jgi:O-antigen/teichoic acid export membrane protein|nr:flippase [Methanobrevibacter sp.]